MSGSSCGLMKPEGEEEEEGEDSGVLLLASSLELRLVKAMHNGRVKPAVHLQGFEFVESIASWVRKSSNFNFLDLTT